MFGSNASVCSVDGLETGSGKTKKRNNSGSRPRIGSILSRASQLLDNFRLLKKSSSLSGPTGTDQTNIPEESKKTAKEDSNKKERNSNSSDMNSNNKDRNSNSSDMNSSNRYRDSISKDRTKIYSSSGDSVLEEGVVSMPQSPLTPESGVFEATVIQSPTEVPKIVKHQGYLNIYSSFNKRKWGKRWCKVLGNNFECYRNQISTVCELEFLLRGCILRRAIEETRSQLGLMLLENNREKITIEPLCWSEVGSWLRVLMGETSTPKPPKGLEGYMEEINQYHDIVEETRISDLNSSTDMQLSPGDERTMTKLGSDIKNADTSSWRNSYRDSGNCSAESVDGRSELSERTSIHPEFSDSSLPRVNVHTTGDIYTQVRKSSIVNTLEIQKQSASNDKGIIPINKVPSAGGNRSLDFGSAKDNLNVLEHEESMVDEVLSKFTSQISRGFEADDEEYEPIAINLNNSQSLHTELEQMDVLVDKNENTFVENRRLSRDLTELDVISPIKENLETDSSEISKHENFLCSSFVDDDQGDDLTSNDKCQALSKSNENHSDNVVIISADDSFKSDLETKQYATTLNKFDGPESAIDKTGGNEKSEKSNAASAVQEKNEDGNPPCKKSELCVEDLAHVLSNLSLEDSETNEDKVNSANKSDNSEINEKADANPEASCDIKRQVPLDSDLNYLDEDARTRRSVVMREMAETGGDIVRTLKELRTKLVQLKKDRISIHDRMQKTLGGDRAYMYLEDEYNRLNREVEKVNEEIACLEQLQRDQKLEEEKKFFDDNQEEIDV